MLDESIIRVLEIFHQQREFSSSALETDFERMMRSISKGLRWLAIGCFPILIIAVLLVHQNPERFGRFLFLVQVFGFLQVGLALMWMIADIVPVVISIVRPDSYAFERRKREIRHDLSQAQSLTVFHSTALELTDKWLALKIDRMKLRIGIYLGGSDKIAVFALVGAGWSVANNLPRSISSWQGQAYLLGLATLVGLAVGGMMVNGVIKQLSYQRDLLAIASYEMRRTM